MAQETFLSVPVEVCGIPEHSRSSSKDPVAALATHLVASPDSLEAMFSCNQAMNTTHMPGPSADQATWRPLPVVRMALQYYWLEQHQSCYLELNLGN